MRGPAPSGKTDMAKGQKKSNREAKKPKQIKPKASVAAESSATRINDSINKSKKK
jgi:hypothetical protein